MKKIIIISLLALLSIGIKANDTIRINPSQISEFTKVSENRGDKVKNTIYCVVSIRGERFLATISQTMFKKLEKVLYFRTKIDLFLIIGKTSNRIYVR